MNITQLSAFLENKPGSLEAVLRILRDRDINIIALTIAETPDFGILRLIVSNPEETRALLKEHNITTAATEVLALELEDRPGTLLAAVSVISKNNLNIEYMYAFSSRKEGVRAVMIFRFDNIEAAKAALLGEGFSLIGMAELTKG